MNLKEIDSFAEEFEEIRDILKEMEFEFSGDYEVEEDEDDEEEYSESLEGDLKGYQEKFSRYAESIKKEIRDYEPKETGNRETVYAENKIEGERVKTPWERGHKLGCGCPGCAKYRKLHGIDLEAVNRDSDLKFPDLRFTSTKGEKGEKEYIESEGRPCGGKLYQFFHGSRAEFKRLLGNYLKKLNLNLAGY